MPPSPEDEPESAADDVKRAVRWSIGGELADLLRSRRERLQPGEVGLPAGGRRRTSGLRREEVASLAGVSLSYYTLLEQGREVNPSRQVVDALARALRFSPAERTHLHHLAAGPTPGKGDTGPEVLASGVRELVDRLDPFPTYVTGRCWDVLAANRAARALYTDWPALPTADRNMLWWTFTDPAARDVYLDWEREAATLLARFRAAAARNPGDRQFVTLTNRLHEASPQARAWWLNHEILPVGSGTKRLRHPDLGVFDLRHVVLLVSDSPDQKVVTFESTDPNDNRFSALAASMY